MILRKEAGPEKIPASLSFRNKSAAEPAVLFWNDIWVTDVMRKKLEEVAGDYNFKRNQSKQPPAHSNPLIVISPSLNFVIVEALFHFDESAFGKAVAALT